MYTYIYEMRSNYNKAIPNPLRPSAKTTTHMLSGIPVNILSGP
jgi:hypothetical protein